MRQFNASSLALLTSFAIACSSLGEEDPNEGAGTSTSPATGSTVPAGGNTVTAPVNPSTGSTSPNAGSVAPVTPTSTPAPSSTGGTVSPSSAVNPAPNPSDDSNDINAPDPSSLGDGGTTTGSDDSMPDSTEGSSNPPPGPACEDTPPDDRETCQTWADWGECDAAWLKDPGYCAATCDRCEGGMSVAPQPQPDPGGDETDNVEPDPMPDPGGNAGGGNPGGALGDDNPFGQVQGGQQGNSTRYWDCCKQSCGWSANASQPVSSCQAMNGQNIGANDANKSVCDGSGGDAQTCHGMAPWAHSTQVSFGYAAANGAGCGTCWQLQFTGTANSGQAGDEGAQRIQGKTMVVMATNIGDLNGALHFDLLIPGGGVGLAQGGCPVALGIQEQELGANRGGFRTDCAGAGNQDAIKECVRNKCTTVFGSRGLSDLEAGCLWYADWFEAADNPDFVVQQIDCPAELRGFN